MSVTTERGTEKGLQVWDPGAMNAPHKNESGLSVMVTQEGKLRRNRRKVTGHLILSCELKVRKGGCNIYQGTLKLGTGTLSLGNGQKKHIC